MVSGSDEHGTPITVSAEMQGISPQDVVDKYHEINSKALLDLGCQWKPHVDPRGETYGGALFNRTSDHMHKQMVQENFLRLHEAGLFKRETMLQYYETKVDGEGRFLPDRYVEGKCPKCASEGARGDQCDSCGVTYEAHELLNPRSKMDPKADIEVRETEHLFFRLDLFQEMLVEHAAGRQQSWKTNVRAMTKQWLDMGLRPRAITRDLEWGIPIPIADDEWAGKCVYVWFEAVQGYLTCAKIWSQRFTESHDLWERWWRISADGSKPRHLYFLGKDNIPFHTVIWPALIMGLNHAANGLDAKMPAKLPGPGDLHLADNVPAMEYLMLSGGQFSKSRKHAVWLPSFLERFDPDTLRYYLGINMPENHDTDFSWADFVEKVNSELIGCYGNFVHRVLTLTHRMSTEGQDNNPLEKFAGRTPTAEIEKCEALWHEIGKSLDQHRFKEGLRNIMFVAQYGNQLLQNAAPWKYLGEDSSDPKFTEDRIESLSVLAFCWKIARLLAIATQPFIPFSSQKLWHSLGLGGDVSKVHWNSAIDWAVPLSWTNMRPVPLFKRLDLEEIIKHEEKLASQEMTSLQEGQVAPLKGGRKEQKSSALGAPGMPDAPEGTTWLDFESFVKVELRTGIITSAEDHPNADKLYVIRIDDGAAGRTICAGLKEYYSSKELEGKQVVFVANLAPRKLRGVVSEGMMLAADDEKGKVKLVTLDGEITTGSKVR